jgi:hypothetical protein
MAGLLGEQIERFSLRVTGSAQSGEVAEESSNPFDITASYGLGKVLQFNAQESTQLSQVFDGPPCGSLRRIDRPWR